MLKTKKKLLIGFVAILVLILVLASLIARSIDLAPYKTDIETAASKAGIRVRIDGHMRLSLIPLPGIEVNDVYVELDQYSHAAVDTLHLYFEIWPLFDREFRITKIKLNRPIVDLVNLPISLPKRTPSKTKTVQKMPGFKVTIARDATIVISNGKLAFGKLGSPQHVMVEGLATTIWFRARNDTVSNSYSIDDLRPSAKLSADLIKGRFAAVENVKARINFEKGKLDVSDITGTVFGGKLSMAVNLDRRETPLSGSVNMQLTNIDVAKSTVNATKSQHIDGRLTLHSRLNWKGTKIPAILRTLQGDISLTGKNLRLRRLDIDKALERIEETKRLNLTDLGAYFYLGPLGAVATKGYQYSELLKTRDSQPGTITHLISNWKIKAGRATVSDVALTTPNNRIAIRGSVNFIESRFENLAFSVVDEKGCGIMAQQINGPFAKPKPSDVRSIRSVGRPFRDALREPIKKLTGADCTVFYTGSLEHPEADKPPQQKSLISDTLQSIGISTGDD